MRGVMCPLQCNITFLNHTSLQIHILDPALKDRLVYQDFLGRFKRENVEWVPPSSRPQERVGLGEVKAESLTFGELDRQVLVFRGTQRPAKRCFTHHAFFALERARKLGWDVGRLEVDAGHFGWQSPTLEARMQTTALWAAMAQQQLLKQEAGSSVEDGASESWLEGQAD